VVRAPQAVRNAASGQRHAACGGAKWPPGGVAALARCVCIALHTAPTQEAISPPSNGPISRTFGISLAIVTVLAILAGPAARAGSLAQRVEAVGTTVDEADDMFRAAMKGHFPSLQAINAARARMTLAKELYGAAKAEAAAGKANQADAKLDAAEFLARQVYEAAKH
jgi:hypothetical protein